MGSRISILHTDPERRVCGECRSFVADGPSVHLYVDCFDDAYVFLNIDGEEVAMLGAVYDAVVAAAPRVHEILDRVRANNAEWAAAFKKGTK